MQQFLKKTLIFASISIIFIFIGLSVIFYTSKTIDYKIDKNVKEIYLGDSHIRTSVMDSLLINSKNVSYSSESFYFSYYKLKKLIEANPNIEKIYLGFSYHSFSYYYDDYLSGEYSISVTPKYFYCLPFQEQFRLIRWNSKNLPQFIKSIFLSSFRYILKDATYNYGGYTNVCTNSMAVKSSMEKQIYLQYYANKGLNNFSEINLSYLPKIINLCKEIKIDLVILNTPLQPYYKSKIPIIYINKFNEIVNTHNLNVFDFSVLTYSDSCFMPDGAHLSVKGAYLLTQELNKNKAHGVNNSQIQ